MLTDVPEDADLMRTEPFGPIATIAPFDDLDDGLAMANGTRYGLAAYAFTRDYETTILVTEGLEAGLVGINTCITSTVEAPFAGIKHSGLGIENGVEGIEAYTVVKYARTRIVPAAGDSPSPRVAGRGEGRAT